ncbi:response regulator [Paenibacillus turpanensis]|uniref:response regulator n=1 Tax=Paenibacillus turpanensis TaxID=2689078 RepID=UPI0014091A58|nr:response regulator [Paenibacillus turpanensis]
MIGRPIELLMIEDNPGDVRLTIEVLKDSKLKNNVTVMKDGYEAIQYLRGALNDSSVSLPDLILLDWNLPRKNGSEVLAEVKSDPKLKRIPVVVLTTSEAEEDIVKAYDSHANCFITKPINLDQFITVIKSIEDFWFTIVKMPRGE